MNINDVDENQFDKPILIATWPGIGNVGLMALTALIDQIKAEYIGDLTTQDAFHPIDVRVDGALTAELEYPECKFYYYHMDDTELLLFVGDEQPRNGRGVHILGNAVLDIAQKFNVQRIYTAASIILPIHHQVTPKVHFVANSKEVVENLVSKLDIIPGVGGPVSQGYVNGLNGILLPLAMMRNMGAACIMGEVPDYLSTVEFGCPKASISVLKVLRQLFNFESAGYFPLEKTAHDISYMIEGIYKNLPLNIQLKIQERLNNPAAGVITNEDSQWLKDHISDLFPGGAQ